MGISASDILGVAERLSNEASSQDCEASRRSAASRAYYAALHAAVAVLPADLALSNAEAKGKDSHSAVSDALAKWAGQVRNGRSEARVMARKLPRLKQVRKVADYRIWEGFTTEQTADALKEAATIIGAAAEASRKDKMPAA